MGCPESFLHALDYSQVAGLFAGMICLGLVVDQIGRKWASVTTAGIMFAGELVIPTSIKHDSTYCHMCRQPPLLTGACPSYSRHCGNHLTITCSHQRSKLLHATAAGVLLTAAEGPTAHAVFAFVTAAQALFGFGCGGEFPVAAASAAERAESTDELKGLRGQTTVLVFSMQVSSTHASYTLLNPACVLIPQVHMSAGNFDAASERAIQKFHGACCGAMVPCSVATIPGTAVCFLARQ